MSSAPTTTYAEAWKPASRRQRKVQPPVSAPSHLATAARVREVLHGPRLQPKLTVGAPGDAFDVASSPFQVRARPDAKELQRWLVAGEEPIGEVLEVVNRSRTLEFIPVSLEATAKRLLVFDRDRAPLGFLPLARDEAGRALVYAKPDEPILVLGVRGRESPGSTRPFTIRENAGRISLRIGQLSADQSYAVKLWFKPLGKPEVPVTDVSLFTSAGGFVAFPTRFREPGTYRFVVGGVEGERLTSKGVYSHGSRREELATVDASARRYAPVFSLTPEEESVPVSPETLLGGFNPDELITFKRWNKQKVTLPAGKLVREVLPYEPGGTIAPAFETTGLRWNVPPPSAAALSYVIVPDPADRDTVHVSYEFFYRFDPKAGTRREPGITAHPFDAEGIIVTMKRSGGEWRPTVVIYRHHIEQQTVGMYGVEHQELYTDQAGRSYTRSVQNILHTWEHGAVKVPYEKTIRTPDGRPAVFVSKAHAPYPYPGRKGVGGYHVTAQWGVPLRLIAPFEDAGGGRLFAPPEAHIPGAAPYALTKREAAETTEGASSALSGKSGQLLLKILVRFPAGSFTLAKTPDEIVTMYVREAEPMATSRVPGEVLQEGYRIVRGQ